MTNANIKVAMPFSVESIRKIAPNRAMGIYKKKYLFSSSLVLILRTKAIPSY